MILMSVLMGVFASCDSSDSSSPKESEQVQETSTANETESVTETETENPYSLSKVVSISLDHYGGKGECLICWGEHNELQFVKSLLGVQRFLYRTQKGTGYREITASMGVRISEGNELLHLIVVFKKGYELTENDKAVLKETGIDYMLES